jgi:hypothetical protein
VETTADARAGSYSLSSLLEMASSSHARSARPEGRRRPVAPVDDDLAARREMCVVHVGAVARLADERVVLRPADGAVVTPSYSARRCCLLVRARAGARADATRRRVESFIVSGGCCCC